MVILCLGKIVMFLSLLISSTAFGWGHLVELNEPIGKAHLVFAVKERLSINYCIDVDPAQTASFSHDSMKIQIISALKTWLVPVVDAMLISSLPKILEVNCDSANLDLKVQIAKELKWPMIASYQLEQQEQTRLFDLVKLDPYYRFNGVGFVDTRDVISDRTIDGLVQSINKFNLTPAYSVQKFAMQSGISYDHAFWTTYRDILHEFGHAFGLCDTIPSQITAHCDPKFLTPGFENTVMSESNVLSLTGDDVSGILELFKRF